DVALSKTLSQATAKHGEQVTYTLKLSNTSSTNATNLQVKDLLPAGLTYVSDDGLSVYGSDVYDESTGVWSVGDLPAGTDKTLNINVHIN
ncbi:MAG TPA: DUF11 domain-containing protein, partial [Thiolinea sp.]|nr:DUF11 domain-containing protein [Thiolinea sp.]